MTGRKPNVSNMRVFGSECYAYKRNGQKLDPRCVKGIFLGYDKYSPAYLVYFPETGKIMKHRIVKFITKNLTDQQTQVYEDDFSVRRDINVNDSNKPTVADEQNEKEEQPGEAPDKDNTRYPQRHRKPPAYLSDYDTAYVQEDHIMSNIDYCYRVAVYPTTYKEAMSSPDASSWKTAIEEEMCALKENDTFTVTQLPEGHTPVGGRWVYTIKESENGTETYKARCVAKGYSQVKDVDYYETFAPTASLTSVRALMQIAAQNDLILHQMDVKSAYLNAPIDCDVYMYQAEGFEILSDNNDKLVYKLNKSLYGLKQSGRNWNNVLHECLLANDFVQSSVDHCIYIKHVGNEMVAVLVWVDDLIIAASNDQLLNEVKEMFNSKFHMKDMGVLSYFIGMSFVCGNGFVIMNQSKYIQKVLEKFEMSDCKPRSTPSEMKILSNSE